MAASGRFYRKLTHYLWQPGPTPWEDTRRAIIRKAIKEHKGYASRTQFMAACDIETLYNESRGRCGICGGKVRFEDATVDHIIPLSKGGAHHPRNLQMAHRRCNTAKGSKLL